jgi:hypothetical protein
MAKVKIVKNERDPPLFTGKLLIKFQNIDICTLSENVKCICTETGRKTRLFCSWSIYILFLSILYIYFVNRIWPGLLDGISDFTILHLSLCLTLFLTPFYHVNVCLLFANKKFPRFDHIVRKCQMYLYRNRQKNEAFLQLVYIYFISIDIVHLFCYTPCNKVVGGYTGFTSMFVYVIIRTKNQRLSRACITLGVRWAKNETREVIN